jgi:integrase
MGSFRYAGTANLYERDGVFYLRYQLSSKQRTLVGCREIRKSLKTRAFTEARYFCSLAGLILNQVFKELEKMTLDQAIVPELARQYLHQRLEKINQRPDALDTPYPEIDIDAELQRVAGATRRHRLETTEGQLVKTFFGGDMMSAHITEAAVNICTENGVEWKQLTYAQKLAVVRTLSRAELEALRIYKETLSGNYAETGIKDPMFLNSPSGTGLASGGASCQNAKTYSLEEVAAKHLAYVQASNAVKTVQDYRRMHERLKKHLDGEILIHQVSKDDVRSFRDLLGRPASVKGKPPSNTTVNKYFGFLKAFLNWAVSEGYLDASPVGQMKIAKGSEVDTEVEPFDEKDLSVLLSSPLFAGYKGERFYARPGPVKKQRAEYWCFMIALLSGMRLGEIVQLTRHDVRKHEDVWVFDINKGDGKKSVKTAAGCRLVPVHPKLLEFGLLEWIKKNSKKGSGGRVFPTMQSGASGDPANKASKRLNSYLVKIGIKKGRAKCVHSLRHTFIDQMRNQNAQEYLIKKVVGHSDTGVTSQYGNGASLKACQDMVAKCHEHLDFGCINVTV